MSNPWRLKLRSCSGAIAACALVISAGCGGAGSGSGGSSSTGQSEVTSLSSLPDFSQLVNNRSTTASISRAVVGTPPAFSSISASDIGTYFFGSLLDTNLSTLTTAQARADYFDAFFEGMAKCQLFDHNARAFAILEESTNSLCYMREAPARGAFTDNLGTNPTTSTIMNKEGSTKTLRIRVMNFTDPRTGTADDGVIIIKILGSNDTSNQYEAYLFFFNDPSSTTPTSYDYIVVSKSGLLTYTGRNSHQDQTVSFQRNVSVQGTLESDGSGGFRFKSDAVRTMAVQDAFSGSFPCGIGTCAHNDTFNVNLAISATQEEMMMFLQRNEGNNGIFQEKIYSLVNYSGSNFKDVAFSAGAAALSMRRLNAAGAITWQPVDAAGAGLTPVLGTEYRETSTPRYATEDSSSLFASANTAAGNFSGTQTSNIASGTTFNYASIASPTNDVVQVAQAQGVSLAMTVTHDLTMDFTRTENRRVQALCEKEVSFNSICEAAWSKTQAIGNEFD